MERELKIRKERPKLPEDIKSAPSLDINREGLIMRSQAALEKLQKNLDGLKHNLG